jgi:hypothetical protein
VRLPKLQVVAISIALLTLYAAPAKAYVWYPQNTSISDVNPYSQFVLHRQGSSGYISNIACRVTASGKTPSNGNLLTVALNVTNCSLGEGGLSVTASDPSAFANLIAEDPTWDPYYGTTSGGGTAGIYDNTGTNLAFVFTIKFGTFIDCTVKVFGGSKSSNGFTLRPNWYSTPHPSEWLIKLVPVGAEVTGPTASQCAPSGSSWYIDTDHVETKPYLAILP